MSRGDLFFIEDSLHYWGNVIYKCNSYKYQNVNAQKYYQFISQNYNGSRVQIMVE